MKTLKLIAITFFTFIIFSGNLFGQSYTFQDFVGTWHGSISSTSFGGYNDQMTMTIESDGFYTETSGHLMPTIYPNSQECEYEASTNRFHWWYIQLVYAGQTTYSHHYYEVVHFENDTLIMHYNFWDDPAPYPQTGTILLVKENQTPAPNGLVANLLGNNVSLNWNTPSNGGGPIGDILGYNIYHKKDNGSFSLLDYIQNTYYAHENITNGMHSYYVTTVYNLGESDPSNQVDVNMDLASVSDLSSLIINMYPNPATQFINIEGDSKLETIRIYNSAGQLQKIFNLDEGIQTKLSIEDLKAGLYLVLIKSGNGIASRNLLKI